MNKVTAFIRKNRISLCMSMMMAFMSFSAMAVEESSFDLTTVMVTSVQTIVNDLVKTIAAVLPIALTLFGLTLGITYTITFVRSILRKKG